MMDLKEFSRVPGEWFDDGLESDHAEENMIDLEDGSWMTVQDWVRGGTQVMFETDEKSLPSV